MIIYGVKIGPIAAALSNKFGFRTVVVVGSFLGFAGLSASVFVSKSNIEILYFTAGFLLGLGIGLVYTPINVGINFYFAKRRSLATGIMKCGSGFGTFVFAPLVRLLLDNYGVRGALLVLVIP